MTILSGNLLTINHTFSAEWLSNLKYWKKFEDIFSQKMYEENFNFQILV